MVHMVFVQEGLFNFHIVHAKYRNEHDSETYSSSKFYGNAYCFVC